MSVSWQRRLCRNIASPNKSGVGGRRRQRQIGRGVLTAVAGQWDNRAMILKLSKQLVNAKGGRSGLSLRTVRLLNMSLSLLLVLLILLVIAMSGVGL